MDSTSTLGHAASRTLVDSSQKGTRLELSAVLFGSNVGWMFLAFIFAQTYTYHRHTEVKPDPKFLQFIVYGLVLLQACQTGVDSLNAYRQLVYGWGDPLIVNDLVASIADGLLPVTDALTGSVVQYYYLTRIWAFSTTVFGQRMRILTRVLSILTGTLPLISSASAMILLIIVVPATSSSHFIVRVNRLASAIWSISSAIVDGVITTCMVAILHHAKSSTHFRDLKTRFDKVFLATLQTGFITAVLAILIVILLLGLPGRDSGFFSFTWFLIGKSYVISFLSILNARTAQITVVRGNDLETFHATVNIRLPTQLSTLAFALGRAPEQGTLMNSVNSEHRGMSILPQSSPGDGHQQMQCFCGASGPHPSEHCNCEESGSSTAGDYTRSLQMQITESEDLAGGKGKAN